jgi:hypothetical protein
MSNVHEANRVQLPYTCFTLFDVIASQGAILDRYLLKRSVIGTTSGHSAKMLWLALVRIRTAALFIGIDES